MNFLGADVDQLESWARRAENGSSTVTDLVSTLRGCVDSVAWQGPDRDQFVQDFHARVASALQHAAQRLNSCSADATRNADEQDQASATDSGSGGGDTGTGGDRSSPGQTEKSGPPVDVPEDVKKQIDDPEAIRKGALDVKQGSMGDCFFLSSLAAVAETNPEFIEKNIWFEDGKYHVRMYDNGWGGPHETVVDVDPKVAANGVRDKDGNVSWMSVYEAAYAQHEGGYDDIEDGGFAQDALPTITGKQAFTVDEEPSFDELRHASEDGCVVVADTGPQDGEDGGWWDIVNNDDGPVPDNVVPTHQYVVKGFTEDGKVIMQNPWGPQGGYAKDDPNFKPGELVLTEKEYKESFQNVTVIEDPDPSNKNQKTVIR